MNLEREETPGVRALTSVPSTDRDSRVDDVPAPVLPLVSIIIVNYNGIEVLPKCLSALNHLNHPRCEIILVDNGSSDGSAEFTQSFASQYPQRVLRFAENRGLAAARNAGARLARGEYLAFLDNDGFPEPAWLDAALAAFERDPRIGAVASLVLFDSRPDIINGLGGGVNHRGFGFDHLFHRPLGFQPFPENILYPMGCGMILRKEAADLIFPIDKLLVNYYDDVEIGIRIWNRGYRVEPCPGARVRHAFNHSSSRSTPAKKEIVCHRNRLRTALKYWPLSGLPTFLASEFKSLRGFMRQNRGAFSDIVLWNLFHLISALWIRSRFPAASHFHLPDKLHRKEMTGYPTNTDFSPDWTQISDVIDIERPDHKSSLDFGWYLIETIDRTPFRCTTDIASAFLRAKDQRDCFLLRFVSFTNQPFSVELRSANGNVLHQWEFAADILQIISVTRTVSLPPGDYQVVFKCEDPDQPECGRTLGVGINFVGLWKSL